MFLVLWVCSPYLVQGHVPFLYLYWLVYPYVFLIPSVLVQEVLVEQVDDVVHHHHRLHPNPFRQLVLVYYQLVVSVDDVNQHRNRFHQKKGKD